MKKSDFHDFLKRLIYWNKGDGVNEHFTAHPIFNVQKKVLISGIDQDYAENTGVWFDDYFYETVDHFLDYIFEEEEEEALFLGYLIDQKLFKDKDHLLSQDVSVKIDMIERFDQSENGWACVTISGYQWSWEYLNSHFTKEAAEAFIKRKSHDYRDGLRVFVDGQYWCQEFREVVDMLICGKLQYKDGINKQLEKSDD